MVLVQILLSVSYDGTNYAGWQRQSNALAVQEVLEIALSKVYGVDIVVRAASRTDAGVHALGQKVCFSIEKPHIPLDKLPVVINSFLPSDIAVKSAEVVSDDFNPRFNALYKTYSYTIYNSKTPNPLYSRYSTFIPQNLDFLAMQEAASAFIGKHDFAAFCAAHGSAKTSVREIYACSTKKKSNEIFTLLITGNGFLYNMVRIITGTVLFSGLKKIAPLDIPLIIASKDRKKAGKTMPPQGLVLEHVEYWTKY